MSATINYDFENIFLINTMNLFNIYMNETVYETINKRNYYNIKNVNYKFIIFYLSY